MLVLFDVYECLTMGRSPEYRVIVDTFREIFQILKRNDTVYVPNIYTERSVPYTVTKILPYEEFEISMYFVAEPHQRDILGQDKLVFRVHEGPSDYPPVFEILGVKGNCRHVVYVNGIKVGEKNPGDEWKPTRIELRESPDRSFIIKYTNILNTASRPIRYAIASW